MINLSIIGRISDDKNSFLDIIHALHLLKQKGYNQIKLTMVGGIFNESLYRVSLKLVDFYDLGEHISFTRQSIKPAELPEEIKQGYFCNFTIGNFMGYSGIDCIDMGFKTIFYNVDQSVEEQMKPFFCMSRNLDGFVRLMQAIHDDKTVADACILAENQLLKESFYLTAEDEANLLDVILSAS